MTAVGKILVFFNLLFSLAVGALTVLNFSARTYWADGYQKVAKQLEVSQASARAYELETKQLRDDRALLNSRLQELIGKDEIKDPNEAATRYAKLLGDQMKLVAQQKDMIRELLEAKGKSELKLAREEVTLKVAQEDVKRRQADVEKIRDTLKVETENNTKLVKEKNELRDRAIGAEIQSKSLREINGRLEGELQELAKTLARLKSNAGSGSAGTAKGSNPPPDNVEGQVKRTDANSGLVTISLGSDAGINKGNTMEVFRLGPTSKYVGRIKIVEVTNTQAVGQAVGRLAGGPIQVGDRVASQILR